MSLIARLILIQLSIAASASMVFASGHTVRNGGGTGELQMTDAWNNLPHALRICFSNATYCGLDREQQTKLFNLLETKRRCFPELSFVPLPNDRLVSPGVCGQPLLFNSKALADEGRLPLPATQIPGLTLRALCEASGQCTQLGALIQQLQIILVQISSAWGLDESASLILQRNQQTDQLWLSQLNLAPQMLNDLLKDGLRCAVRPLLRFENVEFATSAGRAQFRARVRFTCGQQQGDRRFNAAFEKQNGVWVPNRSQFLLF